MDLVGVFCEQWQLDENAAEYVRSLDEATQQTVLAEFAPRDNTHDVAGKMYAFARSVLSKNMAVSEMPTELESFMQRWQLDNAAVAWLTALPTEVRSILITQFEPKEDTHNVTGKMRSFARSIQLRLPGAGSAEVQALDQLSQRLAEFCQRWSIDESALALIRALPMDVQATVIEQFDPKGDVLNVNGKLCSFARSIAAGRQDCGPAPGTLGRRDSLEAFSAHWGLDESAKQLLRGLPEEVRMTVYDQFDPDRGTRDISNKLRMFAKGILMGTAPSNGPGGKGGGRRFAEAGLGSTVSDLLSGCLSVMSPDEAPNSSFLASALGADAGYPDPASVSGGMSSFSDWSGDLGGAAADGQGASAAVSLDPAINEFVTRWGLDEGTVPILESLPEDVRMRVVTEFDPRGNTRNPSGKFIAFVRTVVSGQGRSSPKAERQYQALMGGAPPPQQQPLVLARPGGHAGPSHGQMEAEFLDRWGLVGNQSAVDVLARLQPAVRVRVMAEFAPGHDTGNVLGKFCSFATSVARAAVKETTSLRGDHLMQGYHAAKLPEAGGFGGGGMPSGAAPRTLEDFADRWRLDEGSRALLRGLEPDIQNIVLTEYMPRDEVRDPSGKFCAFARSVASRLRHPPAASKRTFDHYGAPQMASTRRRYE